MKKSIKKTEQKKEAVVGNEEIKDEQYEITELEMFIQKRRLQNKILKQLTENLKTTLDEELNKPKSA